MGSAAHWGKATLTAVQASVDDSRTRVHGTGSRLWGLPWLAKISALSVHRYSQVRFGDRGRISNGSGFRVVVPAAVECRSVCGVTVARQGGRRIEAVAACLATRRCTASYQPAARQPAIMRCNSSRAGPSQAGTDDQPMKSSADLHPDKLPILFVCGLHTQRHVRLCPLLGTSPGVEGMTGTDVFERRRVSTCSVSIP